MDAYTDGELNAIIDDNGITSANQLLTFLELDCSVRTVQRNLKNRGIALKPIHPSMDTVVAAVASEISKLGPVYGRKTVTGHLRSIGLPYGEGRVGLALSVVDPFSHQHRQQGTSRQINPASYNAPYFGYNIHIDQNEKLVDYGVVICGVVDGSSNYLLGFCVAPRKNAILIYQDLFYPVLLEYGMFDSLISDHGREFALCQFVQESIANRRVNTDGVLSLRPATRQMASTENNRIERIWVLVNDRCTLPIKSLVVHLLEMGFYDWTDENIKFAVSVVCQGISSVLLNRLKNAWNYHSIPNAGKPVDKLHTSQCYHVNPPDPNRDVAMFRENGGQLTDPWPFGNDMTPLERQNDRNMRFLASLPGGNFDLLANSVLAGDAGAVKFAIDVFLNLS